MSSITPGLKSGVIDNEYLMDFSPKSELFKNRLKAIIPILIFGFITDRLQIYKSVKFDAAPDKLFNYYDTG